ncbi:Lytic transglycosylase catalytic [Gluconacetobacter diazotrophicus PA1 5]|uniref:lytic transglycosylase domain-containing protein n=1 Tax=Gluconacetobacter diazotrophicus TaxID=33996 RepID=UPI000173D533|nr:lytic transglycosylase domain-containing protein [Gluconacetobacter diazotrophicus]ACI51883.1 Lytic transglycosylase catalytic [Gluconacetobacter diazotrophicus PA1 5]TWB11228.1 sporulation related protein [Gluconacetobacter diazotrophicus]
MTRRPHGSAPRPFRHKQDDRGAGATVAARVAGAVAARVAGVAGLAGLLAACAGTPGPQIPVTQEAANYRAHAKSYYAPPGPPEDPWGPYIEEASKRFDVPDTWIRSVMQRESGGQLFRNGQFVTSAPGAMGLMQLMPPTYDELKGEYGLGDDPFNPHDNILAGTAYIRQMYDIYGSPGFLAAYNTGPGRLDDFLVHNRTLPRETRNYVAAIGPQIAGITPNVRSQADLMVEAHDVARGHVYAAAQTSAETRSVRMAWARRADHGGTDDTQPVQVAEAPPETDRAPAPAYTAWKSVAPAGGGTPADAVRAAWAARARPEDESPATPPALAAAAPPLAPLPAAPPAAGPASGHGFHLVNPAMAEPAPLLRRSSLAPAPRDWAIQVGAFGSSALASQAAGHARQRAATVLGAARPQVASVHIASGHLYRARLTGLSHDAAIEACRRLSGGADNCVVISPDSRS